MTSKDTYNAIFLLILAKEHVMDDNTELSRQISMFLTKDSIRHITDLVSKDIVRGD